MANKNMNGPDALVNESAAADCGQSILPGTLFGGDVYHISDLFGGFFHDVSPDSLPTYSFIEPRYTDVFLGTPNSNGWLRY